jgi:ribosomal RNA methyltransferase Nop2
MFVYNCFASGLGGEFEEGDINGDDQDVNEDEQEEEEEEDEDDMTEAERRALALDRFK